MATLRRIVRMIFRPKQEWEAIAREATTVDGLLRAYILPLALLAPVATAIGMSTFDRDWDAVQGYVVPADRIFVTAATTYFAIVGSIFVLAAIFVIIAPMYGAARDFRSALKVATYGATPTMLAGATLLLPVMAVIAVVALCHTLYLLWLGAQQVLNVPAGGGAEFIAISLVMLAFASVAAGAAVAAIGVL